MIRIANLYDGYDQEYIDPVQDAFRQYGLNPERSKEQLDEIFAMLKLGKPRITCSPCGSGKTENIKIVATTYSAVNKEAKLVIALSSEYVQARILEDLKVKGITVRQVTLATIGD